LRELRGYDKYYQRFKIDDHLRKYKQALHNLSLAGEEHHQAVIDYMHLHELYDTAVEAYSGRAPDLRKILDLRGDWLMKDDRCHEAALCRWPFTQRGNVKLTCLLQRIH
jgi:elongator complex protein 1